MSSLTVHVFDKKENPVSGKRVFCSFPHTCSHSNRYTDQDGTADFDRVPVGSVEIFVEGEKIEVSVGQNDHEDVTFSI